MTTSYLLLQLARKTPSMPPPTILKIVSPKGGRREIIKDVLRGSKSQERDQPGCRFRLKVPLHCRKYEPFFLRRSWTDFVDALWAMCFFPPAQPSPAPHTTQTTKKTISQQGSVLVVSSYLQYPMLSGRPYWNFRSIEGVFMTQPWEHQKFF